VRIHVLRELESDFNDLNYSQSTSLATQEDLEFPGKILELNQTLKGVMLNKHNLKKKREWENQAIILCEGNRNFSICSHISPNRSKPWTPST